MNELINLNCSGLTFRTRTINIKKRYVKEELLLSQAWNLNLSTQTFKCHSLMLYCAVKNLVELFHCCIPDHILSHFSQVLQGGGGVCL